MRLNRREFLAVAAASPFVYLPYISNRNASEPAPEPELPEFEQIGLGVGIPWRPAETDPTYYDGILAALRPPWWYNWKFDQIGRPGYIPMFWRPEKGRQWDHAVEAANAYPDKQWLLYNEPERGISQADPVEAAGLVRDWVAETHNDFSIAGLLTSVDGVGWLERYLDAGGPLPTSWHFHIYGFENGVEWLKGLQGETFLEWYIEFGAELPVIITETNANVNQSVEEQVVLMFDIFLLLEFAPFVSGVGWYSAYDVFEQWPWSNLVDAEGKPTPLGEFYRDAFGQPEG